jgi:hypothetical protein
VRKLWTHIRTLMCSTDLNKLAVLCGTDKWGTHFYTQHYMRYFAPLRRQEMTILEVGVGGYESSEGGHSLRMWRAYFPKAKIVGIDVHDKSHLSGRRIDVWKCDQTDDEALRGIAARYGGFDIVIDDGSHISDHVISTFRCLFPLLKSPGYYCVEDLQAAYWPQFGAVKGHTTMDWLRWLVDGLNHAEDPTQVPPSYYALNISEIAFFHNLCIIRKDSNDEPTNQTKEVEMAKALLQQRWRARTKGGQ